VSFTFSSSQRVRQSKEFEQAFRNKAYTNKWFAIHLRESELEFARLGMVVSKRTMPKSVHRNFAKRLIREIFRNYSSQFPALDYVVRIRRKLTKDSSAEARSALLQLMLSIKII
jgi:ribonuclease P protein component